MCISPLRLKHPTEDKFIDVPCGKCIECCQKAVNAWAFRLIEQSKSSKRAYFITLTYDDEHLPVNIDDATGEFKPCFRKSDVQKLIQALRDHARRQLSMSLDKSDVKRIVSKIKYFVSSEYGDNTWRSHYHGIIFGYPGDIDTFTSDLSKFWTNGFVSVSNCNDVRCYYVVKYLYKARLPSYYKQSPFGELEKPFMICSKGLGIEFLTPAIRDFMLGGDFGNEPNLQIHQSGVVKTIPKYYRDKVFVTSEQKERLREYWHQFDEFSNCPDSQNPFKWRNEVYEKKVLKVKQRNKKDKL